MLKLTILKKNNYDYVLEDNNKKIYRMNIEFYKLKNMPDVGDVIFMSEKIPQENTLYAFGPIMDDPNRTEDDLIKLIINGNDVYLQRYYG